MKKLLSKMLTPMGKLPADGIYPVVFIFFVLLFYPELLFVKAAPLVSDHWEQHYPWAFFLSESLKNGDMPFWTSLLHCGFPIAAESQIGVYYLPNLVLFGFLPFHTAYSWQLLVHFIFSGLGLYLYLRQIRLSPLSAFAGAFIFVFGTGYGGAYYNITSLKTISWLPFMLWNFEVYVSGRKIRHLFLLSLSIGMSLVAGYMQVAILSLFTLAFYGLLRLLWLRTDEKTGFQPITVKTFFCLLISSCLGMLIALPQIMQTFQLALQSNRAGMQEAYAYAGSMPPLALATLFLPHFQGLFRGNCVYSGISSVFFVICAFIIKKETGGRSAVSLWGIMALFSLLFAFGGWSPVYMAFVKLTHFYSFRTPSKFLIFFDLAFAVLAALGLEKILLISKLKPSSGAAFQSVKQSMRIFVYGLAGAGVMLAAAYVVLRFFRAPVYTAGEWVLRKTLYGQPGHPHSWETYQDKLNSILDFAINLFSLYNFWNVWILGVVVSLAAVLMGMRTTIQGKSIYLLLGILSVELYAFSWADVRSDFASYSSIQKPVPLVDFLLREKKEGRLLRIYNYHRSDEALPTIPSVNMLYGFENLAAYSPLISKRFYETLGLLGDTNDSNYVYSPPPAYVLEHLPHLRALAVSHIVSTVELKSSELQLLFQEPGIRVYSVAQSLEKRAYVASNYKIFESWEELRAVYWAQDFDPAQTLLLLEKDAAAVSLPENRADSNLPAGVQRINLLKKGSTDALWEVEVSGPSFFIVPDFSYPGWKASINGSPARILEAYGLFQTVFLPAAGTYRLSFEYNPWEELRLAFQL